MKRLFKAAGMVERDALLARLRQLNIDAITPERDVSRKVTDSTIDLSLGGYSAVADGFSIFVPNDDFDRAEDALAAFLRDARLRVTSGQVVDYWQKYFACSLFSLTVPLVMNVFATYHLAMAIRIQGRPRRPVYFVLATLCYFASWAAVIFFALSKFGLA